MLSKTCLPGFGRCTAGVSKLAGRSVISFQASRSKVTKPAHRDHISVADSKYRTRGNWPSANAWRVGPGEPAEGDFLQHSDLARYDATIAEVAELREKYVRERYIFVESDAMIQILKGLGAKGGDFSSIRSVSDRLPPDPTLPFRETKNGRFCFDPERGKIRRLAFQPFALSVGEDFKRHDSGQVRHFAEIGNDLQLNSVLQALMVFKILIIHGVVTKLRPNINYADSRWICTLFNLRTVTTPEVLGEPALEGVHMDGVDHTMTTYLGSHNMDKSQSCVTAIHSTSQETGIAHDKTKPELCLGQVQHQNFLDTLLIVDNERKHSLSALKPDDSARKATRDMLILFTRKPAAKGHISEHIDSMRSHKQLPMQVALRLSR